jgi:hypothetical protein
MASYGNRFMLLSVGDVGTIHKPVDAYSALAYSELQETIATTYRD